MLHHWTHAILVSIKGHESNYQFPLTEDNLEIAAALEEKLKGDDDKATIIAFHEFIKIILYPRSQNDILNESDKWTDLIECLFALSALQEGGIFKSAHESTQMMSCAKYHIRGALLYEGYANRGHFNNSLYRYVYC